MRLPSVAALAVLLFACIAPPPTGNDDDGGASVDGGGSTDGGGGTSIACGDTTCGPNQYCHDECLCCGVPGGTPASQQTCEPIPAGCTADDLCGCPDIEQGGLCDPQTRTVTTLCA